MMRIAIAAIALCAAPVAFGADGELSLGTGINYTTGKYGESEKTSIVTIPILARYERDAWSFRATVPYLRISGPGTVIPGIGHAERHGGRGGTGTRTESGMGDSTVSASYTMYSGTTNRSGVGATGKLKLATGDEDRGLGTGSTDVSFQVDAFQEIERNTVFGVVGYTIFGDSSVVQLENVANVGIGASRRLDTGDSVGLAFDARQGATPAPAPQRELTAFWNHKLERNWRTQAYFLKGFARGSPDWGLGVNATVAF
jgi:hypothetical protein